MEGLLAVNKIVVLFKTIFKDAGYEITYNQFLILMAVSKGHITLKELRNFLLMEKAQICRQLKELTESNMLHKNSNMNRSCYSLTIKGEEILLKVYQVRDEVEKTLPVDISNEELKFIRNSLIIYQEALQNYIFCSKKNNL